MKDIVIYGAGGLGRETALLIQQINQKEDQWNLVGFYDDALSVGVVIDNLPVLGGMDEINALAVPLNIVIAIADPHVRQKVAAQLRPNHIFPTLIHPTCQHGADSNQFGKGCIMTAGVILTTGITLGDFVIVNLVSTLGHDVDLGNYTTVMPGCSISGNVVIGEASLVGTGSRILQNISIGKGCKIGAGAVVTHSCLDNKTLVGVPAYEK